MAKSLFMVFSMPRLYQQLLRGIADHERLGEEIVNRIKTAQAFRRTEAVEELSRILINLPVREYQLIGQYYLVWCKCRTSQYDNEALEQIIDETRTYRTRALISRAAFEGYQTNMEGELYFYTKALQSRPAVSEYIDIRKSLAVVKAKEGFHSLALKELEEIIPIIRQAEPLIYFDVLNSYAVELGEAGRKDEARSVMRQVLASPFAFAYPEWHETAEDLKPARRSFVAVETTPHKALALPEREPDMPPAARPEPGRVLNFMELKKKMAERAEERQAARFLEEMSLQEMMFELIDLITGSQPSETQMRTILAFIRGFFALSPRPTDTPSA